MISEKTLKHFVSTVKYVHFWGSLRFDYDSSLECVTVPQSSWRKVLAALNVVAHLGYALFLIFSYLQLNFSETTNGPVKAITELAVLGHLCPTLCFHLCFFLREEAMANFINQFLTYHLSLQGKLKFSAHSCVTSHWDGIQLISLIFRHGSNSRLAEEMRNVREIANFLM